MSKNIKRHAVKKRIQEVPIGSKVPGSEVLALPYWDFMARYHDDTGDGIVMNEDSLANPDVVPAETPMYNRPLTAQGKLMLQAVQETMKELTPQQQAILQMMHEGVWSEKEEQRLYTQQAVADALGVAQQTVDTTLTRIKTKVRRRYEKLKTTKE